MSSNSPKIAIVCDFLTAMGGAENVVLAMHEAFPEAPIYTALHNPSAVPAFNGMDIRTTKLQRLPSRLRKSYRLFPTLAVKAFQELDLSEFDIILTSSYLVANQVRKTRPDQVLISYCHTPARYYWSHYEEYRKNPGYGALDPLVKLAMPLIVPGQRKIDYEAAQKVDLFIANSTEVQKRIKQYYNKPSTVLHPPVDIKRFNPSKQRKDYYVALGRQVPYKRIDLAVEACTRLGVPLKVFGSGNQHQKLVDMAGPTISFYTDRFGDASDEAVEEALSEARGFLFPTEEDFGIVQVEALASGSPVIAYGKAGTLDIVEDKVSGVLFKEQTAESLIDAMKLADKMTFMPATLQRKAKRFEKSMFVHKLKHLVNINYPIK